MIKFLLILLIRNIIFNLFEFIMVRKYFVSFINYFGKIFAKFQNLFLKFEILILGFKILIGRLIRFKNNLEVFY